jgi:predicted ArsR family transcriptional regulator
MATVEDTETGLVLSEHNCPIYDVAVRFPKACQCEQELFERVLNVTLKRENTLVEGASACRYRVVDAGT